MYAIKMEADKTLISTVKGTIYQYEKNTDTLLFLIPQKYEKTDIADCTMLLRYILPTGIGKSEEIEIDPIPYNDEYYLYRLKVGSRFTDDAGDITLWLSAINIYDNLVLKSSELALEIEPSKDITEFLSDDDKNQLDVLTAKVDELEKNSVDGLLYDADEQNLQLAVNGKPVGNEVELDVVGGEDIFYLDGGNSSSKY